MLISEFQKLVQGCRSSEIFFAYEFAFSSLFRRLDILQVEDFRLLWGCYVICSKGLEKTLSSICSSGSFKSRLRELLLLRKPKLSSRRPSLSFQHSVGSMFMLWDSELASTIMVVPVSSSIFDSEFRKEGPLAFSQAIQDSSCMILWRQASSWASQRVARESSYS